MPIVRDLILTVNNDTASLNEKVYLYRGDRGIELRIKIQQYKFKFNRRTTDDVMTNIYAARAIVHSEKRKSHSLTDKENGILPEDGYNSEFCFEVKAVNVENDIVVIPINRQWIDNLDEVGTYRIQIQLYGADPVNERITIPPVEFYVKEEMCDIPDTSEDAFDKVNKTDETPADPSTGGGIASGFNNETKLYEPYKFGPGEVIRSLSLNGMEDALYYTTVKIKEQNMQIIELNSKIENVDDYITYSYSKDETDELLKEQQDYIIKNIKGDTGTSILRYRGELQYKYQLNSTNPKEGDAFLIDPIVYVWNGSSWDETDIKGPKGDKGDPMNIVFSTTAPEDKHVLWVDESAEGETYVTETYMQQTLDSYASKEYVDELIEDIDISLDNIDTGNLATKEYVDQQVANLEIGDIDASVIATKRYVDNAIPTKVSAFNNDAGYAKVSEVPVNVSQLNNDMRYATWYQIPTNTSDLKNDSNFLVCDNATRVLFVTQYPSTLEDGVLYILVERS